jgi:hypothetical protein
MWKIFKVIDADGHMHEPQYLWERYVEPKYRDQVPKVAFMDGNFMVYEHVIGSDSFRLQKSTHLSHPVHAPRLARWLYTYPSFQLLRQPVGRWDHSSIARNAGVVSRRHFMK